MSFATKTAIKRKREPLDDFGEFLGKGSFAFVVASRRNPELYAYRIGVLKNTNPVDVRREVEIQKFLYESDISPCFPAVFELEFIDTIDDIENDAVRERLKKHEDLPIFVVKMERGTAGDMKDSTIQKRLQTDMNFFQTTHFMLVWSVWAANSRFGFRHRDIKPANIVFKKLKNPTVFNFKIEDQVSFTVKTDTVPLLIDYGFASLLTTREIRRHLAGTIAYYPPEILCRMMVFGKLHTAISSSGYHPEDTFDLWGIAASLLAALNGKTTFGGGTNIVSVLAEIMSFMKVEHNQSIPTRDLFTNGVYSLLLFTKAFTKNLLTKMDTEKYIALREKYPARIDQLKYFMRWNPLQRAPADFYKLFEIMFPELMGESDAAEATYANPPLPLFEFNHDETFREKQFKTLANIKYIRSDICDTCEAEPARFVCTCCAKVLCDERCHD